MWFYELRGQLRQGLAVEMRPTPQVSVGVTATRRLVLPLGRSIRNYLTHPDDSGEEFSLVFGNLEATTQGLVLTQMPEDEAQADRRALLLVNQIADSDENEVLSYERGQWRRQAVSLHERALLFQPWSAIRVTHQTPLAMTTTELRWDGRTMTARQRTSPAN